METLSRWTDFATRFPWVLIALEMLAATLFVILAHNLVRPPLLRLTARLRFSGRLLKYGGALGAVVLLLCLFAVILDNAPEKLSGITFALRMNTLALILALSWLGIRCVRAVADSIVEMYPVNGTGNVQARRIHTQTKVFAHCVTALIILVGLGLAFFTLPVLRKLGATFLASAGVAGLLVGLAAKPVLGNLLAGVQLALTQPIRLGDVVIVEQEWGWIDEITGTYVVIRIWDERRLVVPLQRFIEHPFQNWTRNQTAILGTVTLWADYRMPVQPIREEAERICQDSTEWNREVCVTHVTDATEHAIQVRVLVSAGDAGQLWDLRCKLRERLVDFVQRNYSEHLTRVRGEIVSIDPVARRSQQFR